MTSPLERRRFPRLMVPLKVEYRTHSPDAQETLQGHGVLRDISLGGTYFHIKTPAVSLKPGQILSLIIFELLPGLGRSNPFHLKARGEVVRVDPPGPHCPFFGVALRFLEGLSFFAP